MQPRYDHFNECGGSCPSIPCLSHYLTFSFTPLNSSFEMWIFSSHVIAYVVTFDSRSSTRESDIIRPRYELSNACGDSCASLPCLSHYLTFAFTPLSSSFEMWIFSSHVIAYVVTFDSRSSPRESDIKRPRYELSNACGDSCASLPCL